MTSDPSNAKSPSAIFALPGAHTSQRMSRAGWTRTTVPRLQRPGILYPLDYGPGMVPARLELASATLRGWDSCPLDYGTG